MNKVLVSLHDKKSRSYGVPIAYDSFEVACRDAKRAVQLGRDIKDGQKPLIAMYPEDFELLVVGVFNVEVGEITETFTEPSQCVDVVNLLIEDR